MIDLFGTFAAHLPTGRHPWALHASLMPVNLIVHFFLFSTISLSLSLSLSLFLFLSPSRSLVNYTNAKSSLFVNKRTRFATVQKARRRTMVLWSLSLILEWMVITQNKPSIHRAWVCYLEYVCVCALACVYVLFLQPDTPQWINVFYCVTRDEMIFVSSHVSVLFFSLFCDAITTNNNISNVKCVCVCCEWIYQKIKPKESDGKYKSLFIRSLFFLGE